MRSSQHYRIAAFLRSAEMEQAVRDALAAAPELRLEVVRDGPQAYLGRLAAPAEPDLLLVDTDLEDREQIQVLRALVRSRPAGAAVVVTSAEAGVEAMRQLMRLRIADYLPQPFAPEDLLTVIDSALKQFRAVDGPVHDGCAVISFIKPAGGMGGTTLAIQTAFELAARGRRGVRPRVCLVDLDFQFGSAATYLDLEPNLNIAEIARAPQRLDAQLLQAMTAHHEGGVDLLAAPDDLMALEAVTTETVLRLLEVACDQYDHVVIDMPQAWTQWSAEVLAGSDVVLMVLQLAVAAVKKGRLMLDALRKDRPDLRIEVVLNRYERSFWRQTLRAAEAERALDRPIAHFVGNDFRLVSDALNRGVPLAQIRRRNRIQKQVRAMVSSWLERPARETAPGTPAAAEMLTASR